MNGDCPLLSTCPFFNETMANMPAATGILKAAFCRDDFEQCARYRVAQAMGRSAVPANLFPSEGERANILLERAKQG